ncbi:hypothetical protein ACROYT_G034537 [Oculina patagonica]
MTCRVTRSLVASHEVKSCVFVHDEISSFEIKVLTLTWTAKSTKAVTASVNYAAWILRHEESWKSTHGLCYTIQTLTENKEEIVYILVAYARSSLLDFWNLQVTYTAIITRKKFISGEKTKQEWSPDKQQQDSPDKQQLRFPISKRKIGHHLTGPQMICQV